MFLFLFLFCFGSCFGSLLFVKIPVFFVLKNPLDEYPGLFTAIVTSKTPAMHETPSGKRKNKNLKTKFYASCTSLSNQRSHICNTKMYLSLRADVGKTLDILVGGSPCTKPMSKEYRGRKVCILYVKSASWQRIELVYCGVVLQLGKLLRALVFSENAWAPRVGEMTMRL